MGTLGILAFLASINLFAAETPQGFEKLELFEEQARASGPGDSEEMPVSAELSFGLHLLDGRERRRGEMLGLDTPVGRFEVMLLWSDAQLQLGMLEEPLDEAVVGFAPAGVFIRTERPTGRVVLSLPVLRF